MFSFSETICAEACSSTICLDGSVNTRNALWPVLSSMKMFFQRCLCTESRNISDGCLDARYEQGVCL